MKSDVTVIIPNYNGIKYIRACLDSLMAQTMPARIIVVDNASTDGSAEAVGEYGDVRLIRFDENHGFCRAVNEGIKQADTEYVILLNNDTKADPDFVLKLYGAIDGRKDVFSVAAKMLQMNDPDRIDSAGDLYCALGWAFSLGKGSPKSRYDKKAKIFSACAGAAIYRRALFDEIGLFDEKHISYLEDVDVGYRARIRGYMNLYAPGAIVFHAGSATTGSKHNPFKVRMAARNSRYLVYKNMPLLQIIINIPFLLAGFAIKAVFFAAKGYGKDYLSGVSEGYRLCAAGRKNRFEARYTGNYCRIQLELWINMFRRIFG